MYQKNIENNYIVSLVSGVSNGSIREEEYNAILDIIRNKPTAPEGYDYRLKVDLTWELAELPSVPEYDEEASAEDYEAALGRFGV